MSDLIATVLGASIALILIALIHNKRLPPCEVASLNWSQGECR